MPRQTINQFHDPIDSVGSGVRFVGLDENVKRFQIG
jgi:hypothetical protein